MQAKTRFKSLTLIATSTLLFAVTATQAATPEQKCQRGRYAAAAQYAACQQKVLGKFFGDSIAEPIPLSALSKCSVKYTATWDKLVAKGSESSTCVSSRYDASVAGTVTDKLTGLQWEQKTNLDGAPNLLDRHDADNSYRWSLSYPNRWRMVMSSRTFWRISTAGDALRGNATGGFRLSTS
jgi:hypothetical protein